MTKLNTAKKFVFIISSEWHDGNENSNDVFYVAFTTKEKQNYDAIYEEDEVTEQEKESLYSLLDSQKVINFSPLAEGPICRAFFDSEEKDKDPTREEVYSLLINMGFMYGSELAKRLNKQELGDWDIKKWAEKIEQIKVQSRKAPKQMPKLNTAKIKEAISEKFGIKISLLKRVSKIKDDINQVSRMFDVTDRLMKIVVKSDPTDTEVLSMDSFEPASGENPVPNKSPQEKAIKKCPIQNPDRFIFCHSNEEGEGHSFAICLKSYWDKHHCLADQTPEDLYNLSSEGFNELTESVFEYDGPHKKGLAKLKAWGFIESEELKKFLASCSG